MKRVILAVALIVSAALRAHPVEAQGKSLTGLWTLKVEHIGLKLELTQKNTAIKGTLDWPHGDPVKVTGKLAGKTLTFAGDSSGENFSIHVESTGTVNADGTMTGSIKAHFVDYTEDHKVLSTMDQDIPWTAERGDHGIVHFAR
jgi:hypothetical protein